MAKKQLVAGNEALGEAAIIAGAQCYFGYPITPQNEFTAYMARRMPEEGRVFLQTESELAAINMVLGAAAVGARALTSSSSPGVSLKQEGISYMAGDELPGVVANIQRGGPGLGNIAPTQSDYFQATKGGGHGDYRNIVLAPHTVQECVNLMILAFDLAEKWRMVSVVLADGVLGQMMEPVVYPEKVEIKQYPKDYILDGAKGREPRIIRSLYLVEGVLEKHNEKLQAKYAKVKEAEQRHELDSDEDVDMLLVACGTSARACRDAMRTLNEQGRKIGLFRPITLWPFPEKALRRLSEKIKKFLVVEMNAGQMVEDVRLHTAHDAQVHFYGRMGGGIPTPPEIVEKANEILG
jgi:2-oxoglutarate ferredoxin oxidoreductase subunit alpha